MRAAFTVLALGAALLACQKGDEHRKPPADRDAAGRPASLGAERMATVDDMVRFVGGVRKAIEANQQDCARMARALSAEVEQGQPALDKARALEKELAGDQAALDWIQGYVERRTGGFEPIRKGLERCGSDPAVQASLGGFLQ